MIKSNKPISFVLKPIVLSIQIALAAGLSAASVSAFSKEISVKNYQIAAGDLSAAVNQFAIQSGVALSSDGARLSGMKTAGLKGAYSIEASIWVFAMLDMPCFPLPMIAEMLHHTCISWHF